MRTEIGSTRGFSTGPVVVVVVGAAVLVVGLAVVLGLGVAVVLVVGVARVIVVLRDVVRVDVSAGGLAAMLEPASVGGRF